MTMTLGSMPRDLPLTEIEKLAEALNEANAAMAVYLGQAGCDYFTLHENMTVMTAAIGRDLAFFKEGRAALLEKWQPTGRPQ